MRVKAKVEQKKVEVVEIDEKMLDLIQKLSLHNRAAPNGKSLAHAKLGAKKRKRREFDGERELETKLDLRYMKLHAKANDPFGFTMPKRALPQNL